MVLSENQRFPRNNKKKQGTKRKSWKARLETKKLLLLLLLTFAVASGSERNLAEAIQTVLSGDGYRRTVAALSRLMKEQPETPLRRAAYWVIHLLIRTKKLT